MTKHEELNLGSLPGRKRKALQLVTFHERGGASVKPLAYFVSDEACEKFKEHLKRGLYWRGGG